MSPRHLQASGFATPDQSQLGGTHKSGQQQDACDRDSSAGLGADPVISSRAFWRVLLVTLLLSTTGTLITVIVYLQLIRGHLFQQDHRMAILELQSTSNTCECLFSLKTDDKIPKIYVIIFAYI